MSSLKTLKLFAFTLALVAGSAQAALIQYSESFSSPNSGSTASISVSDQSNMIEPLNLSKFDDSLGDLTDVSIVFDTNWLLSSSVNGADNYAVSYGVPHTYSYSCGSWSAPSTCTSTIWETRYRNDVYAFGTASNQLGIQLSLSGASASASNLLDESSDCSEGYNGLNYPYSVNCSGQAVTDGDFMGELSTAGFSLNDFIASSPSDILLFSLTNNLRTGVNCGGGDICDSRSNSRWYGQVSVLYSYNERNQSATVPEPSVIALFSLGLIGLGLSRRRKH